jgi:hypothetical protein
MFAVVIMCKTFQFRSARRRLRRETPLAVALEVAEFRDCGPVARRSAFGWHYSATFRRNRAVSLRRPVCVGSGLDYPICRNWREVANMDAIELAAPRCRDGAGRDCNFHRHYRSISQSTIATVKRQKTIGKNRYQ